MQICLFGKWNPLTVFPLFFFFFFFYFSCYFSAMVVPLTFGRVQGSWFIFCEEKNGHMLLHLPVSVFLFLYFLSIFYQCLTRMGRCRQRQSLRLSDKIYHEIEHLHKRMRSVLWLGLTPLAPPLSFGKAERSYKAYELWERS